MAIRYQRSVSGNSYDPLVAPDSSDKIQEQSRAYIESLKRRREQETLQQAAFVEGMRRKVAAETQSLEGYANQTIDSFNVVRDLEERRQQVEARRESLARQAATGRPDPAKAVLEFVTQVVPSALSQFGEIQEQAQAASKKKGMQIGLLVPPVGSIAETSNLQNGQVLSAENSALAAQLEAAGVDPNIVDQVRSADQYTMVGIRHTMSKGLGNTAVSTFNAERNNPNTQFQVDIDGQMYALNQLPDQSVNTLNKAWMQFVPDYFGTNGFDDVSVEFLSEGLQIANQDWQRFAGAERNNEIKRNKADLLDQKRQKFAIDVRDPTRAVGAFQDIYTAEYQDSLSHAAANGKIKEYLMDPNMVPQNVFDDLEKNLVLPGRPKPYAEDRPADWAEIKEARQQALNRNYGLATQSKQIAAQKEATRLGQMIAADMEGDQELNMSDDQFKELYSRFQAEGIPNDPRLTVLNNNEKYLASTVQQQEQVKEFTRLAEKGALTEGMVFRSTLEPEQKKQLYRQITSGAVPKIDQETNRRAKQYIKGSPA